jgi:hypothetical protein
MSRWWLGPQLIRAAHVVILLSVPEALPAPEAYPVVSHSGNFR